MSFKIVQSTFDPTQKKASLIIIDATTTALFSATIPLQIDGSETVAELEKKALEEIGCLLPQALADAISSLPKP